MYKYNKHVKTACKKGLFNFPCNLIIYCMCLVCVCVIIIIIHVHDIVQNYKLKCCISEQCIQYTLGVCRKVPKTE